MPDALRLFFGLPCPPGLAEPLSRWRDDQGLTGRAVPPTNLHMTLAFLGMQPSDRLAQLRQLAANLRSAPFTTVLDRLYLGRKGLLWIEPSQPPAALIALADTLRSRLLAEGLEVDERPYRPHVTLIRHGAQPPDTPSPAFEWAAERFALFVSEGSPAGVRYRILADWPLQS